MLVGQAGQEVREESSAGPALPQGAQHVTTAAAVPKETPHRTRAANIHSQLPAAAPATQGAPNTLASLHCPLTGRTTAVELAPQRPVAQGNSEFLSHNGTRQPRAKWSCCGSEPQRG